MCEVKSLEVYDEVDYFYVTGGLIGNMPRPNVVAKATFSHLLLGLGRNDAPLSPESLRSRTFGLEK